MTESMTRPEAIATARRMRAAGWSLQSIRTYLTGRGVVVKTNETILRWTDEQYAERIRRIKRDRERARWRARNPGFAQRHFDEQEKLRRLFDLSGAGLKPPAIAKVVRLDLGDQLTATQVRRALETGRYPRRRKEIA